MPTVPSNMIAPPAGDPEAQDAVPTMGGRLAEPRRARGVAPTDEPVGERDPAIDRLRIEWAAVSPERATPGLPAERAPPLASPLPQIQHESVGRRTPRGLRRSDDRLGSCPTGERSDVSAGRTVKAPLIREPVTARPLSAPTKAKHETHSGRVKRSSALHRP